MFFVVPDYGLTSSIFTLDGAPAGTFNHTPTAGAQSYLYNQQVFSISNLKDAQHVLIASVTTGGLIAFDYASYT
jgi:hypothetical protein